MEPGVEVMASRFPGSVCLYKPTEDGPRDALTRPHGGVVSALSDPTVLRRYLSIPSIFMLLSPSMPL